MIVYINPIIALLQTTNSKMLQIQDKKNIKVTLSNTMDLVQNDINRKNPISNSMTNLSPRFFLEQNSIIFSLISKLCLDLFYQKSVCFLFFKSYVEGPTQNAKWNVKVKGVKTYRPAITTLSMVVKDSPPLAILL